MIIDYTLEFKKTSLYPPLPSCQCRGDFRDMKHFEHFKSVEKNRGKSVTNERIIKG